MGMFDASDIEVKKVGNYQQPGVEKDVKITDVVIQDVPNGSPCIQLHTINSKGQKSVSRKLYLNTEVKEGKQTSAWKVSAKFLKGILMSFGYTVEQQNACLKADTLVNLVAQLKKSMVCNKSIEALFSSKEYIKQDGTIGRVTELYSTAPFGSNILVWDENNKYYNEKVNVVPKVEPNGAEGSDLPF
jgi:hypothetical protein